jgi:hypothetical protein
MLLILWHLAALLPVDDPFSELGRFKGSNNADKEQLIAEDASPAIWTTRVKAPRECGWNLVELVVFMKRRMAPEKVAGYSLTGT